MKLTTTYFEGMGQAFTPATLAIAAARAATLSIQDTVLASYTGYTMQRVDLSTRKWTHVGRKTSPPESAQDDA